MIKLVLLQGSKDGSTYTYSNRKIIPQHNKGCMCMLNQQLNLFLFSYDMILIVKDSEDSTESS
jgi:hypothetical protein